MHKIGLNFIMKNEAKNLINMLESVLPLIDFYVCVDTGSTDNSKEIVKIFFESKNIPGEIHDHPFVDFEDARNYALQAIKGKSKWAFWIDCDEKLEIGNDFNKEAFINEIDQYDLISTQVVYGTTLYTRTNILRVDKQFRWQGKVHEVLVCDEPFKQFRYDNIKTHVLLKNESPESIKQKYLLHAEILEREVSKNNSERDVFYLAQSYRDAGEYEKSIFWYKKRVEMLNGFWEERYYSQFMVGSLLTYINKDEEAVTEYLKCSEIDSGRAEHLLNLIILFQKKGMWQTAKMIGDYAVEKYSGKLPNRLLFIDEPTYMVKLNHAHNYTLSCLNFINPK